MGLFPVGGELLEHSDRDPRQLLWFEEQWFVSDANGVRGTEPLTQFLRPILTAFAGVTVLGRRSVAPSGPLYPLPAGTRHIALPPYRSVAELGLRLPRYAGVLRAAVRDALEGKDAVLLNWPHPVSLLILGRLRLQRRRVRTVLIIGADAAQCARFRQSGFARAAARGWIAVAERILPLLAPEATILTCGGALRRRYAAHFRDVHDFALSTVTAASLQHAQPRSLRPGSAFRLVYAGRLEPEKGVRDLIVAVGELRSAGTDVTLDIVGDGAEYHQLRQLVSQLAMDSAIRFHGLVPHGSAVLEQMKAADALVCCSRTEGFPAVLLEATSVGTPIIASAVGGIPFALRDGESAILFDPEVPGALRAAVARAAATRESLGRLVRAARTALAPYAYERSARTVVAALRDRV